MRRNVNSSSEKPADSIAAQLDQFLASSKKERTESHQQIEKLFEINKVQSDCIVGLRKTVNLQADVLDMKQSRIEALEWCRIKHMRSHYFLRRVGKFRVHGQANQSYPLALTAFFQVIVHWVEV
ncbi:MAG: hypothetical protein NTU49_03220 [Gammaproteobacteria bacterium]|nr:hypothetical protein [Gammaproteobacteria bacterium]